MRILDRLPPLPAAPCAKCGTEGGYIPADQLRPIRYRGVRYGIAGKICKGCYDRHQVRRKVQWQPIGPRSPEPPEAELRPVVIPRMAAVSAAKRAKDAQGLPPVLTDVELEEILPDTPEDIAASEVASALPGDAHEETSSCCDIESSYLMVPIGSLAPEPPR